MKVIKYILIVFGVLMLIGCTQLPNSEIGNDTAEVSPGSGINEGPAIVSQNGGYAVKAGGNVFCIDNFNIYRLNEDRSKERLCRIPEVQKIIPYGDWLIYTDQLNKILYAFNYQAKRAVTLSSDAWDVVKVVDDDVYFISDDGLLKKTNLNEKDAKTVEPFVCGAIYKDGSFICQKRKKITDENYQEQIIKINCRTGERKILFEGTNIQNIYLDEDFVYYNTQQGLFRINQNGENQSKILDTDKYHYIMMISNNSIIYTFDNREIHIYNIDTKEDNILCDNEQQLKGYDAVNGWFYYITGNATYRMKDDGSAREHFCDMPLTAGFYNSNLSFLRNEQGLVFINDWIYFFKGYVLHRINVNTKTIEQILETPMQMPWWQKI